MNNKGNNESGKILFINARSCGTIQQLDILDNYLMEQGADYAAISDPRLTATSPMGSKNYELWADEKSRYYVCFAIKRRSPSGYGTRHMRVPEELVPITDRAAALYIPGYRVHLLVVYGMPNTDTHTENDRAASWAELHAKIFEQMRDETIPILMGGDLNAHINAKSLLEGDHPERGKCVTKKTDANGRATLELCKALQLTIMNYDQDAPKGDYTTYMGNAAFKSSTVDYVCVSGDMRRNFINMKLTTGRPPHSNKTDHKGLLVQWKLDSVKRMRENWTPRRCPFSEQGNAQAETSERKYDDLVEMLRKKDGNTGRAQQQVGRRTEEKPPSTQLQLLLDRRMRVLTLKDVLVREAQLGGIDTEIEVLSTREEREKWSGVEKEIEEACRTGQASNILKVVEKHFGAPKRKVYVSQRTKDALLKHMKSVVAPVGLEHEVAETSAAKTTAKPYVVGEVEEFMKESATGPKEDVFTDTSYGMEKALHILTWAMVSEGGGLLHCGPVPFKTFGAKIPTARNGEDWAILEALARTRKSIRIFTDSKHTENEFKNWGKLVRSEFMKTEGGDSQVLRTMDDLRQGRRTEVVYGEGHTIGTLNHMAHVGARYAAARGKNDCAMKMPEGMTWERVCALHKTERLMWQYMDSWDSCDTESIKLESSRLKPRRMSDEPPTFEETILAMQEVPEKVASGYDEIGPKDFAGQGERVRAMYELLVSMWVSKSMPQTLRRCVMVCVTKDKSAPLGPANCRGLSLLSYVIKVLNNVIRRRLQKLPLADTQIGFVPGHNVHQGIQVIKAVLEAIRDGNTGAVMVYVDLHKAFDSMSRKFLGDLLFDSGFSETAAELLLQLWEHEIVLRFPDGDYSEAFHPTQGTMQGLGLSPIIFTLVMEAVLRQTHTKGVQFFSKRTGRLHCFKNMAYADDLVVVCTDAASAGAFLDSLAMNLKRFGLSINTVKTKVMVVNPRPKPSTVLPMAQVVSKAIDRGDHVSQHPDAERCGVEVRQSIAVYFGGGKGMETLVVMASKEAEMVVCPHPSCGVVFSTMNRHTGNVYTTKIHTRLLMHLQEQHAVERIAIEAVGKVTDAQRRRCAQFRWPETPRYKEELMEKMLAYDRMANVMHDGKKLEEVTVQKYLGALIDATGGIESEIDARVAAGNRAFHKIPRGLWTSGIKKSQKAAVYKSLVLSVVMFGAEAWVTTEPQSKRLERLVTDQLRTVLGLHADVVLETWDSTRCDFRLPRVESVWRVAQIPRMAFLIIRARLRLAGQWVRMHPENELMHLSFATTLLGEHGTWWKQVQRDAEKMGLNLERARNRVEWEKALKALGRIGCGAPEVVESDDEYELVSTEDLEEVKDLGDDPDDNEEEWDETGDGFLDDLESLVGE